MTYSCLYEGLVRHRRFRPVPHAFSYRLFMLYLDLDELPGLFARRWLWSVERVNLASFRRRDHVGDPAQPLAETVRRLVEARTGARPTGPIRLLTHLRYFGYVFNPVSFYFCFDPSGTRVDAIVAEITNTPWGERHCYVLGEADNRATGSRKRYRLEKVFHVSPFMGMDVRYDWAFTCPATTLAVHMENRTGAQPFFDATMRLRRTEISGAALARALAHYPFLTAKVIGAIYWQAMKLWIKGVPVHEHPATRSVASAATKGESLR